MEHFNRSMTPERALMLSIRLWKWLEKNPTKGKHQHPRLSVINWFSRCALCEQNTKNGLVIENMCSFCAMFGIWPTSQGYTQICNQSAYTQWRLARYQIDRSFFAAILVEAFQTKLMQLRN